MAGGYGGRPAGQKNRRGHSAGGKRKGSGRKSKEYKEATKRQKPSEEGKSQVEEQHRREQERKRIERDERLDCMHHDNIQKLYDLVHQDPNETGDGESDADNLYDFIPYGDGQITEARTETEAQPSTKTVETNAILQEKRQYLPYKNSPLSHVMEIFLKL